MFIRAGACFFVLFLWAAPVFAEPPTALEAKLEEPGVLSIDGFTLDKAQLAAFYAKHDFLPVWFGEEGFARADRLLETLARTDRDGLRPEDYAIVPLARRMAAERPLASPETELLLSHALLHYITDVKVGRMAPKEADPELFVYPRSIDAVALLEQTAQEPDPPQFLQSLTPAAPEYRRLRDALARYREIRQRGGFTRISSGTTIKLGDRGPRVAALRNRLAEEEYLAASTSDTFDEAVTEALRRFQENHGMAADGLAGKRTLARMNESTEHHIRSLILNLERWRWLPDDLGPRHIRINIAGFSARAFQDGREVLRMRVIVGKPLRRTPIFSSELTDVIFHPYWYVPERIAREDLLPQLRARPAMLEENGFTVFQRTARGKLEPAAAPDWSMVTGATFPYVLRQNPSPKNSLGAVRFGIRNDWDIYMHGTAAQYLFDSSDRALSSGCIRLERPFDMALFVLDGTEGFDRKRIEALYNNGVAAADQQPIHVSPRESVKVHVLYSTAWADEDGSVHFVEDVYGRDEILGRALEKHK